MDPGIGMVYKGERMRWITNSPKERAREDIAELSMGHKSRIIVIGDPKETDSMTSYRLKLIGMVGLYDE